MSCETEWKISSQTGGFQLACLEKKKHALFLHCNSILLIQLMEKCRKLVMIILCA